MADPWCKRCNDTGWLEPPGEYCPGEDEESLPGSPVTSLCTVAHRLINHDNKILELWEDEGES